MMSRDELYDALYETLKVYGKIVVDDPDYRDFTYGMKRAPNGVSLDQAVLDAFSKIVPPRLASLDDALNFSIAFLQTELVDYWRSTRSQVLVDSLRSAMQTRDYDNLPEAHGAYVIRLMELLTV